MTSLPSFLSTAAPLPHGTPGLLGGAILGQSADSHRADWPVQRIFAPLFGSTVEAMHESWRVDSPVAAGVSDGIVWRKAGGLLYGVIELDESGFEVAGDGSPLQAASKEAYRRLFRLLDSQRVPHLWRVWNYLAAINDETHGLERYRQFNIGRQDAFLECRRNATGNVPAACAIGLAGGPLSIAFLAGETPAVPVENPRQISAYNYPADYGPCSPTFSRAALASAGGQQLLFVSGTASIVGHQTVHAGDVAGQTKETMANIAAVLAEANRRSRSTAFALGDLSYRIYVRHADDFPAVAATLQPLIGNAEAVYVQADICRRDLLLEIEAVAAHPLERPR